jgi:hypothetical protein
MPVRVDALIELLRGDPLVTTVRVAEYDETPSGSVELKLRCRLSHGCQLQVWLHSEGSSPDYAYQLFTAQPLLRWDNAPHYPDVTTAPHHFHDETGRVRPSPLAGEPLTDLPAVLRAIAQRLNA